MVAGTPRQHVAPAAGEVEAVGAKLRQAEVKGLKLRKKTLDHLHELTKSREYLTSRYDPSDPGSSPLTRLKASLHDVRKKVSQEIQAEP